MSNIEGGDLCRYVQAGTARMTSSNYNEIDGLVFSSLVYGEFESSEITWTREDLENGISLKDYAAKMLALYPDPSTYSDLSSREVDLRALLKAVSKSPRYSNCIVTNLAACKGNTMWEAGKVSMIPEDAQWAAMTINIDDGTNTAVIAMRGTDGTTLGWSEDLEIGYEEYGTTAQRLSRDYLATCEADRIALVGHSKGGNDVVSAYMMSEKSVRDKVFQIYNYDGPGNNNEFIDNYREAYDELEKKVNNYFPRNSVIGQLLTDIPGKNYYCEANTKGHTEGLSILGEHDQYAWEFDRGDVPFSSEQGKFSEILNRVLDQSLRGLSNYESSYVLQALIKAGIPALIAKDSLDSFPITIDYSSWQAALLSVMQAVYTSIEQLWCIMNLMRILLDELAYEGLVILTFPLPSISEFYSWIRGLSDDVFRNFKDEVDDLLSWIIYGNETGGKAPIVYEFTYRHANFRTRASGFSVQVDKMMLCAERLERISANIRKQVLEIETVKAENTIIGLEYVTGYIESACAQANTAANNIENYGEKLYSIAQTYSTVEKDILNMFAFQV